MGRRSGVTSGVDDDICTSNDSERNVAAQVRQIAKFDGVFGCRELDAPYIAQRDTNLKI